MSASDKDESSSDYEDNRVVEIPNENGEIVPFLITSKKIIPPSNPQLFNPREVFSSPETLFKNPSCEVVPKK
jgi:hypothetical protein